MLSLQPHQHQLHYKDLKLNSTNVSIANTISSFLNKLLADYNCASSKVTGMDW
ncbi:10999_t:CDS:2, partial [Dentiscutata erythropus]